MKIKTLLELIDKLQKYSEIQYPENLWSREYYFEIAYNWQRMGNEEQLRQKLKEYETKLNILVEEANKKQ